MKKLLYFLLSLFIYTSAMAQTPGTFNYQAAIRDASGGILANEDVFINISILQGSSDGTTIYSEDWDEQTSALGLVNLEIGSADPQASDCLKTHNQLLITNSDNFMLHA